MKLQTSSKYPNAINLIAINARKYKADGLFHRFLPVLAALAMAGCSSLPDKPTRTVMYDFGPGSMTAQPTTRQAPLPPIAVDDITTAGGALDNMSVLYRLNYLDGQQLRAYAQARWSTPPAQLVRPRSPRRSDPLARLNPG